MIHREREVFMNKRDNAEVRTIKTDYVLYTDDVNEVKEFCKSLITEDVAGLRYEVKEVNGKKMACVHVDQKWWEGKGFWNK